MRIPTIVAFLAIIACARPGSAESGAPAPAVESETITAASTAEPYAPMAPFAPFAGKTFRAEWTDEAGATFVDIAKWELILDGRALQSTHRLENNDYGGRTIFFFDEGKKKYVFHYFTTAGFHTLGEADFVDGGLVTEETVEGHPTAASVRAKSTFAENEILIDVVYVGKDGSQTPGGRRVYRPIDHDAPLFADTR